MSLKTIGQHLKQHLETRFEHLFRGGDHYLLEVKLGDDANQEWKRQTRNEKSSSRDSPVRIIHRRMDGVIKSRQKELYPWVAFCFKPVLNEDGEGLLNLKAVKNISQTLWAMVRVHEYSGGYDLCCYVGRTLPSMEDVINPQIRIPFHNRIKLPTADRPLLRGALFSDNPNLGMALQALPTALRVEKSDQKEFEVTLKNIGRESLTLCSLLGHDVAHEEQELDGVSFKKLKLPLTLKPNKKHTFTLKVDDESALPDYLIFSYCETDEDRSPEEHEGDEETCLSLFETDEKTCHIFLAQGHEYGLLKQALMNPDLFIDRSQNREELFEGMDSELDDDYLLLNEADLEGGSLGTVLLKFKSPLASDVFEHHVSSLDEEEEFQAPLTEDSLTYEDQSALPSTFLKSTSKSKKKIEAKLKTHLVDLLYVGQILFYNDFDTPDQGKLRDFILNCVSLSTLLRVLQTNETLDQEELDLDLIDDAV
jgi:hypothetical protein